MLILSRFCLMCIFAAYTTYKVTTYKSLNHDIFMNYLKIADHLKSLKITCITLKLKFLDTFCGNYIFYQKY